MCQNSTLGVVYYNLDFLSSLLRNISPAGEIAKLTPIPLPLGQTTGHGAKGREKNLLCGCREKDSKKAQPR